MCVGGSPGNGMAHVDDLESAYNTEETVLVFVCLFLIHLSCLRVEATIAL